MKPPNFLEVFCKIIIIFLDFIIFLIYDFPLRQVYGYAAAEMVADVMVAAADSDRHDSDGDGEIDSDHHDSDGDGGASVLFDSGNNIWSNCMDSHIYSRSHHDLVLYQKARCMNSMSSTPIKQSKSFSYLLLFIMF